MDFVYELFLRNYTRQKIKFMEKELGFQRLHVDLGGHKIFFLKRPSAQGSDKTLFSYTDYWILPQDSGDWLLFYEMTSIFWFRICRVLD